MKMLKETKKKRGRPKSNKSALDKLYAQRDRLKGENLRDLEIKERYISTHLWEYLKPYRWQDKISDNFKNNLIVLAPAPNGIGKTLIAMCILASWVEGYEAWNPVDADYPDAVKVNGKYFKPSCLGIKPPVDIRVTGEDWNHHLKAVVVKTMKTWFPLGDFDTKRNTSGVEYFWTHKKNGSTIEMMTNEQDVKLFEGWRGHGWILDEASKHEIFNAMARGLAEKHGKILIPTTPLTQAWMLDELILKNRTDVSVIKGLTLYDNEGSYGSDNKILDDLGLGGKRTKYWRESDGQKKHFFDLILRSDLYIDGKTSPPDDQGVSAEKYLRENAKPLEHAKDIDKQINDLIFLRKAKDTSLDEKPSRFFGMFKKLVGLIFKEFRKPAHIVPDDGKGVPTNWIVTFQIDFHLGKPHAIAFYACSDRNIHYCIDEVWENMTAEEIASLIIRKKKANCWRMDYGEIDPLSKGDDKYIKNRDADAVDSFTIIEELLEVEGIELGVASKDMKSGYSNIKSWLKGPSKIPIFYFLDSLQSIKDDLYGHIHEVQRLCYVDGEPEKKDNHFMECWYRYTNCGIEYSEPKKDDYSMMAGAGLSGKESWMG